MERSSTTQQIIASSPHMSSRSRARVRSSAACARRCLPWLRPGTGGSRTVSSPIPPLYPLIDEIEVGPLDEFLDRPIAKIIAGYRGDPPTDLARRVRELVDGLADVTYPLPENFLLDLMPPGIDKSRIVEAEIAKRGIGPDQVVAFGDMPNAIELVIEPFTTRTATDRPAGAARVRIPAFLPDATREP